MAEQGELSTTRIKCYGLHTKQQELALADFYDAMLVMGTWETCCRIWQRSKEHLSVSPQINCPVAARCMRCDANREKSLTIHARCLPCIFGPNLSLPSDRCTIGLTDCSDALDTETWSLIQVGIWPSVNTSICIGMRYMTRSCTKFLRLVQ